MYFVCRATHDTYKNILCLPYCLTRGRLFYCAHGYVKWKVQYSITALFSTAHQNTAGAAGVLTQMWVERQTKYVLKLFSSLNSYIENWTHFLLCFLFSFELFSPGLIAFWKEFETGTATWQSPPPLGKREGGRMSLVIVSTCLGQNPPFCQTAIEPGVKKTF